MELRPYQKDAVAAIHRELALKAVRRTVAVLATGAGKTVIFSKVIEDYIALGERVLVLAHRKELLEQAAERIMDVTGIGSAIEQGSRKEGGGGEMLVIGSVQSMVNRLDRFPPDYFGLVITDECHRAVSAQHTAVIEHFEAKGLGVTATPNRGDKVSLARLYDSVAYEYDISDAIPDGWLVPIHQHVIETDIDFSKIRTTAGDFNQGDLEDVMIDPRALYQIAGPTIEMAKDRQTMTFAVTVQHAWSLAEAMKDFTKDPIAVIDGKTDRDERRRVVDAYRHGDIRHLVNCAVLIEGFDGPGTALISMARPTKSALLYKQCIGRGTRTLPGVVDPFAYGTPEQRRNAIANSAKKDLLVLDFAGSYGCHQLCNALSVLDGRMNAPEKAIAEKYLDDGVTDILEAYRLARAKISEMELGKMREMARKNYRTMRVDPFLALGVDKSSDPYARPMTSAQGGFLDKSGIPCDKLDMSQASKLISTLVERSKEDLATYKQASLLIKRGLDPQKVMRVEYEQASKLIDGLAKNNWKEPTQWATDLKY